LWEHASGTIPFYAALGRLLELDNGKNEHAFNMMKADANFAIFVEVSKHLQELAKPNVSQEAVMKAKHAVNGFREKLIWPEAKSAAKKQLLDEIVSCLCAIELMKMPAIVP